MTTSAHLDVLTALVEDLAGRRSDAERFSRLLTVMRRLFPSDAVALLRLDGDTLVPLAIEGLSDDTLGRRFRVAEHPRFARLLESPAPTRFASDSDLPDPYDGLVKGLQGHLPVHDCLGCPLLVDGRPWGLVTLDALKKGSFDDIDLTALEAFARLAAATVSISERVATLAHDSALARERAEALRQTSVAPSAEMIGASAAHRSLIEEIGIVGPSDLTVLITGETGVGKELVANAIHVASARAAGPMIRLNCAALPELLVESELFGHVRGAFSGATAERRGKFEIASGGTLFLDEVGELSLSIQAKLLRVLQSGELQRVGSDHEHRVDIRLIAATNRDLAEEVRQRRFRADLYHRLTVYPLKVPPLRARGRDVLLLAGYFLEENRSRLGLRSVRLSADAQAALLDYDWPGNVRELEHLIARSALKALGPNSARVRILTLAANDLALKASMPPPGWLPTADGPGTADFRKAVSAYERALVAQQFDLHQQNWAATARALGLDRGNLNRLAKRLGLKPASS